MKAMKTMKAMKEQPSTLTLKGPVGQLREGEYWVAAVTVRTMTGRTVVDFYEFVNFRKYRARPAAKKLAESVRRNYPFKYKIHVLIRPAHDGCA